MSWINLSEAIDWTCWKLELRSLHPAGSKGHFLNLKGHFWPWRRSGAWIEPRRKRQETLLKLRRPRLLQTGATSLKPTTVLWPWKQKSWKRPRQQRVPAKRALQRQPHQREQQLRRRLNPWSRQAGDHFSVIEISMFKYNHIYCCKTLTGLNTDYFFELETCRKAIFTVANHCRHGPYSHNLWR